MIFFMSDFFFLVESLMLEMLFCDENFFLYLTENCKPSNTVKFDVYNSQIESIRKNISRKRRVE